MTSRIPRPRTWLGRDTGRVGRRATITRSSNLDLDLDEDEEEKNILGKGKDLFSASMGDVLESIFNDIDKGDTTPVRWEDAMEMLVKVGGKAVAMGTTLVLTHGILIGVKHTFQRLMVFRW